jgi:hypothetical protein
MAPPPIEADLRVPTAFRLDTDSHRVTTSPSGVEHVHFENAALSVVGGYQSRLIGLV